MKVVLVNPQMPFNAPVSDSWIRMGLGHLSSVLKTYGYEVALIDFRLCKDWEDSQRKVVAEAPEMVCIGAFSSEANDAIHAARLVRKTDPRIVIVIGGIHASIAPETFRSTGLFDCILKGEGEISIARIAYSVKNGLSVPKELWGATPDLDKIPFCDRELWPDFAERTMHPPAWKDPLPAPWVEFMITRGCPFRCRFCSGPGESNHFTREIAGYDGMLVRKPNIRGKRVENVIRELQELDSKYHFKSIMFHDDQFVMNPVWTFNFCNALVEAGLDNKRWWIGSRADIILKNKPLFLKMQKCGLDITSVGFESFSDPLLKFWNKGTTVQMNYDAAAFLKESGIRIFSNTIMGAPREDGKWHEEDDRANITAIQKIQPDHISLSQFTAVPGSDLYQWCKDRDLTIAKNPGSRGDDERKIRGVDYHKVWLMMDEVWPARRPFYHSLYDRVCVAIGKVD